MYINQFRSGYLSTHSKKINETANSKFDIPLVFLLSNRHQILLLMIRQFNQINFYSSAKPSENHTFFDDFQGE